MKARRLRRRTERGVEHGDSGDAERDAESDCRDLRERLAKATSRFDLNVTVRIPSASPILRGALRDLVGATSALTAEMCLRSREGSLGHETGVAHLAFLERAVAVLQSWNPRRRQTARKEAQMLEEILRECGFRCQSLTIARRAETCLFELAFEDGARSRGSSSLDRAQDDNAESSTREADSSLLPLSESSDESDSSDSEL